MFLLRACGLRVSFPFHKPFPARHLSSNTHDGRLRVPTIAVKRIPPLARWNPGSRRFRTSEAAAAGKFKQLLSSFDHVTVYSAGTFKTTLVGFSRVVTIFLFGFTIFAISPSIYFDPITPNWWIPAAVVASAVPMVVTAFASAPFVGNIRVILPPYARRSKESLFQFAQRMPPNTRLLVQTMRFVPWPMNREIHFSYLRRIPETQRSRGANLEIHPSGALKARQRQEGERLWYAPLAKRMFARLYVDRSQQRDRSTAPGVWDIMWDQIPMTGTDARRSSPLSNPMVLANREPAPPKPLDARAGSKKHVQKRNPKM